jgi:dephospho-CoA kinase
VLSSDEVVHGLMGEAEVVDAIVTRFGADVLDADGVVDRAVLGPRAFAEEGGIAFLEDLIHPRVEARRKAWVAQQDASTPPPPLLVCEVPLLFEVGVHERFDAALVVTASEAVRRARVEARGQRFAERHALQVPEAEKVSRADRAYVNDGSLEELQRWVSECFAHYAGRPCDE